MSTMNSSFNLFQPIALGSDHAGFDYTEKMMEFLQAAVLKAKNFGTHSKESVDYPDFAPPAATAVVPGNDPCPRFSLAPAIG